MAENFYEMYLEEMELIRPLDPEEEKRVLAAAAGGDKEAGNRLVEGNLARALAVAKEYEGKELPISDLVQESQSMTEARSGRTLQKRRSVRRLRLPCWNKGARRRLRKRWQPE